MSDNTSSENINETSDEESSIDNDEINETNTTEAEAVVPFRRRQPHKIFDSDSEGSVENVESSNDCRSNHTSTDIDESEDDEEEDERAISPRTRMSITGIRPHDLTDEYIIEENKFLSSTTCQEVEEEDIASELSSTTREEADNDSAVKIISIRNETIEIFSSDDEEVPVKVINATKPLANCMQPKITLLMPSKSAIAIKESPSEPKQGISKDEYKGQLKKQEDMKLELKKLHGLVKKCGENLPDGGRQLKLRIENLSNELNIISKSTKHFDDNTKTQVDVTKRAMPEFKAPNWDELSAAVQLIEPKHTGKKGMATFNAQLAMTVDRLKSFHDSMETRPGEHVLADDPVGLKISLMKHQRHALAWMSWREKQKPPGGILADDMGLGKTLTIISMVLAAKQRAEQSDDDADNVSSDDENTKNKNNWISKGSRKSKY